MLDVEEFMDKIETLKAEANVDEGWIQLMDENNCAVFEKKLQEGKDSLLRCTLEIDLPPKHANEMFFNTEVDCLEWKTELKAVENIEQTSEDDKLTRIQLNLPWAVKYLMSVPEWMTLRFISRKNWPEDNHYAYACFPYDDEKKIPVEEVGAMKIKSGIICPHPEDPNKCLITSLDKVNLKYLPNFALKKMLKSTFSGKLHDMVNKYKKSTVYTTIEQ